MTQPKLEAKVQKQHRNTFGVKVDKKETHVFSADTGATKGKVGPRPAISY